MKSSNFFLFYFSLIATTILLLVSIFFLPKPQNILNTILLAPVAFYLWTHSLNPDYFRAPKWSPKFGALSLVLCILGIFSYFLATKFSSYLPKSIPNSISQEPSQANMSDAELKSYLEKQIGILSTKIDSLGKRDLNTLGAAITPVGSPSDTILGQVTAKDANLTDIAIYESSATDSKVVGTAKYGINYPYYEKDGAWAKISDGWVEMKWFIEVTP